MDTTEAAVRITELIVNNKLIDPRAFTSDRGENDAATSIGQQYGKLFTAVFHAIQDAHDPNKRL